MRRTVPHSHQISVSSSKVLSKYHFVCRSRRTRRADKNQRFFHYSIQVFCLQSRNVRGGVGSVKKKKRQISHEICRFLWKRYRVLIEFPGGGVTCPSGGSPALQGGQPGPRGGTCHRGVQSERLLICLFLQRTDTVGERIDFPHEHTEYLCIHFCIH